MIRPRVRLIGSGVPPDLYSLWVGIAYTQHRRMRRAMEFTHNQGLPVLKRSFEVSGAKFEVVVRRMGLDEIRIEALATAAAGVPQQPWILLAPTWQSIAYFDGFLHTTDHDVNIGAVDAPLSINNGFEAEAPREFGTAFDLIELDDALYAAARDPGGTGTLSGVVIWNEVTRTWDDYDYELDTGYDPVTALHSGATPGTVQLGHSPTWVPLSVYHATHLNGAVVYAGAVEDNRQRLDPPAIGSYPTILNTGFATNLSSSPAYIDDTLYQLNETGGGSDYGEWIYRWEVDEFVGRDEFDDITETPIGRSGTVFRDRIYFPGREVFGSLTQARTVVFSGLISTTGVADSGFTQELEVTPTPRCCVAYEDWLFVGGEVFTSIAGVAPAWSSRAFFWVPDCQREVATVDSAFEGDVFTLTVDAASVSYTVPAGGTAATAVMAGLLTQVDLTPFTGVQVFYDTSVPALRIAAFSGATTFTASLTVVGSGTVTDFQSDSDETFAVDSVNFNGLGSEPGRVGLLGSDPVADAVFLPRGAPPVVPSSGAAQAALLGGPFTYTLTNTGAPVTTWHIAVRSDPDAPIPAHVQWSGELADVDGSDTTYKVTIDGVTVSVAGSAAVGDTLDALHTALTGSSDPEFTGVTWTKNATSRLIIGTGKTVGGTPQFKPYFSTTGTGAGRVEPFEITAQTKVAPPAGLTVSGVGVLSWPAASLNSAVSPVLLHIYASNAFGWDTGQVEAYVITEAPVVEAISDRSTSVDTTVQAYTVAGDTGAAAITWSLTQAPAGVTIDSATGLISVDTSEIVADDYTVIVRATNLQGFDEESWTLTVVFAAEGAPQIVPLGNQTHSISIDGVTYLESLTLVETADAPTTWSFVSGEPSGMAIFGDETAGAIIWSPAVEGVYTITYKAQNAAGSDTDTYELTVVA